MSTWVLLRGLGRGSRHWLTFPDTFIEHLPEASVVALDLPGNGSLFGSTSPTRVEDMAAHCRAQLHERGLAPPYHLLAMSLGAMVAVAWADRYPEELRACVLINTSLRSINPFYRRLRLRNYPRLARLAMLVPTGYAHEQTILRLTSRAFASSAEVVGQWCALAQQYPVTRSNMLRQLIAAARYRAPRSKPRPPLLLLSSAADALVDARCSSQIARIWQADALVHASAGHDLPLDDGPWIAAQVRRWIESAPAPR